MSNLIVCDKCGNSIEVSQALSHQIQEQLQESFKKEHQEQLEKVRQDSLRQAREKAMADIDLLLKDKSNESQELKEKLAQQQEAMLDLSKKNRELARMKDQLELDNQKVLNEEREKLREEAVKIASEKSTGELSELRKQLDDTRKALDSANYKLSQTSQQLQGEVLELDLEKTLREAFIYDEINPIGKGTQGGDIIQVVKGQSGRIAGIILWETKDAKWSPSWLPKLREDGRKVDAGLTVLVCRNLPPDIENFKVIDGVLVTSVALVLSLATLLRRSILQVAVAKQTAANKDETLEFLYDYLQSEAFRNRFESFAEGIRSMQEELESERRSMERIWKRRETQIKRMMLNTSRMYGELQGVMGNALPEIKTLSLPEKLEEEQLPLEN